MNAQPETPVQATTGLKDHLRALDEAITASGCQSSPSLHQYVSRHGKEFESAALTAEETALISQIDFHSCLPRQCYRNSQMAALTLPPPPSHTLRYVEGFFSMNWGLGVEHAWLTLNGKLVDITLRRTNGQPILGVIPDAHEYIGVEMNPDLCRHIMGHRRHISLLDDYECGRPLLKLPPSEHTTDIFPEPPL